MADRCRASRFWEGKEFRLSATVQNVFNHPNWARPSAAGELVGQAAFGSMSSLVATERGSSNARFMQLRERIVF